MEVREVSAKYLAVAKPQATELGVFPSDWKIKTLADFNPYVTSGSRGWARYYAEHGAAFVRITNLSRESLYLDLADLRAVRIPPNDVEAVRTSLRDGDILISITADVGIVGYVTSAISKPAFINQHIALVRIDATAADPKYIGYFLASPSSQERVAALTDAGAKAGMNLGTVQKISVALPPTVGEQRAIAAALADADALIESLEQLLAKKRQIKQGAMQELLTGQRRLPGFGPTSSFKQTDLGLVPEDWDAIHIGAIAQCLIGLTYSPSDVHAFGTLVLRSSNVQCGRLAFDDNVFVQKELPSRVVTQVGDILVCVRNGSRQLIGKCALIDEAAAGGAFGAFMAVLRSASSRYLFQQFQSSILTRQINERMGATINQITNKDMAEFKVIWPRLDEERVAIANALADADEEVAALNAKLTKARHLKQAMMQALLTGRIRLAPPGAVDA